MKSLELSCSVARFGDDTIEADALPAYTGRERMVALAIYEGEQEAAINLSATKVRSLHKWLGEWLGVGEEE